LDLFRQ